jgi:TM2 domain-containing membrane protein YozV
MPVTGALGMPYGYVAPKSPGLSLLASFFFPGLGSIINGDVARGIGIMIGYFISWLLVIVVVGLLGVFGFWVWGMVDAYAGARAWNARHGIVS